MAQALSRHNSKILKEDTQQPQPTLACNCRGGQSNWPVDGKSRTESVVYRATVRETVSGKTETYTGLTGREFKERWYEHRTDMNNTTKQDFSVKLRLGLIPFPLDHGPYHLVP